MFFSDKNYRRKYMLCTQDVYVIQLCVCTHTFIVQHTKLLSKPAEIERCEILILIFIHVPDVSTLEHQTGTGWFESATRWKSYQRVRARGSATSACFGSRFSVFVRKVGVLASPFPA